MRKMQLNLNFSIKIPKNNKIMTNFQISEKKIKKFVTLEKKKKKKKTKTSSYVHKHLKFAKSIYNIKIKNSWQ